MKRDRVYFSVLILILISIATWASYNIYNTGKNEEIHTVSVIVNNSNNDRWTAFRQGLEQAADDYNIDLNFVSTGAFASVEEEVAMIHREIDNGAEGVIVQMFESTEELHGMEEISSRAAVMLLETDVMPEDVYAFAGADNNAIGTTLAEVLKQEFGDSLAGKRVGVLCGNQKQLAMQERLAGVVQGLEGTGADIIWTLESVGDTGANENTTLKLASVDIVIALENDETERVVDSLQGSGTKCLLYGVGCSEKAVYYLDKGVIRTLVVPNEFQMGYQSLEAMAAQLQYHLTKAEHCVVDYLVVNRDNLYDVENQKILFPIVQ